MCEVLSLSPAQEKGKKKKNPHKENVWPDGFTYDFKI
jgi:hypothetical protein